MLQVAQRRSEVYDFFHGSAACQQFFFAPERDERYVAYYNSMYLLQDATESLMAHRARGFSANEPLLSYLEFWGVLQAVIIQQDSIAELWEVMVEQPFNAKKLGLRAWPEVRELRNVCAGHPAKKDRPSREPMVRSFMGRAFGNYDSIVYERWQQGSGTTHPTVNLGVLLDTYASEAEAQLCVILNSMRCRWS